MFIPPLKRTVIVVAILTSFSVFNSNEFEICQGYRCAIASESIIEDKLIAKSSGGRSGGGSFKKKPSGSSKPRKSRPSSTRNSRPRRTRNLPSTNPSRRRSYSSPTYPRGYNDSYRNRNNQSGFPIGFFLVIVFLTVIIVLFIILKKIFANSGNNNSNRERDNNIVTVSKLQVALIADATKIQKDLSELSLNINTDTDSGLMEFLQESVLVLLRNSDYWSYVLSSSDSVHIDKAESEFQKLSIAERSKFDIETLTNVDGKVRQREAIEADENDISAYVVVTLILGTADDKPLFETIHSQEELQTVLENLASIRDDYLMKFELLWSPQTEEDSLTYDELITEYTNMIKL